MKTLLLALLCAGFAFADAVPSQRYILVIDDLPYDLAGDYISTDHGPATYQQWLDAGTVDIVISWLDRGLIQDYKFIPCLFDTCVASWRVISNDAAGGGAVPRVSEPGTWMMLFTGALLIALARMTSICRCVTGSLKGLRKSV